MNRRALLKGIAAVTAGLVLPPTLAENVEAARRYWALDRTMVGYPTGINWLSIDPGFDDFAMVVLPYPPMMGMPSMGYPGPLFLWDLPREELLKHGPRLNPAAWGTGHI